MSLAGVSICRVEDVAEALRDVQVLPGTVSELNMKVNVRIKVWRDRKLKFSYPYIS